MAEIHDLIARNQLSEIRPGSKDSLAVHAAHFASALELYRRAASAEWKDALDRGGAIDMTQITPSLDRLELVATLYAPGLVGALARTVDGQRVALDQVAQRARVALTNSPAAWRVALEEIVREIEELA